MSQPTLEEILEAIQAFGANNDQQALMNVAEAVQDAVNNCTSEDEDEEDSEDSEDDGEDGPSESDEDETEVEVTNVEEVDHLTTLQLKLLGQAVTSELANRAFASEEGEDEDDGEESESDGAEDDEDGEDENEH